MILIVDSGSTKADWFFVEQDKSPKKVETIGFNPMFIKPEEIKDVLVETFSKEQCKQVVAIYFYGAGCWNAELKAVIERGLRTVFPPSTHIEVDHDLLGAARAACGREAGIACIMGTGSNTCEYDGNVVTDNVDNLGYLLGDEGSGSHLGKKLLRTYFYREMPKSIQKEFETTYNLTKQDIIDKVYGEGTPNVFLASFAKFMSEHRDNLFIKQMVIRSFDEFIQRHVTKYKNHTTLPINFVGSVAYHFSDILELLLDKRDLKLGRVIRRPIDSLAAYHLEEMVEY